MKNLVAPTLALASALLLSAAFQGTHAKSDPAPGAPRANAHATAVDPKEAKVRKLMQLSGAGNLGKQLIDAMLDQFNQMPNIPEGFVAKFKEKARAEDLVDLVVPIYVKHFDDATLQAVLDFYQSDAGRTFAAKQPQVLAESQRAGQKWGMELAQKVLAELNPEKPARN